MGGLCSKEEGSGPSSRPVKTLASAPTRAPMPKVGGPARTVGGSTTDGTAATNAALAAERRANAAASKPKGALGRKLEAERKMTDNEVLKKAAAAEIRRRDGEVQVEAQAYN